MSKVFVYGTLKPGEAYYQAYCAPYVVNATPAMAQGYLFHLPQGYPAMTVGQATSEMLGEQWIMGVLLHFRDDAAIAQIDEFEDYNPALADTDNDYLRQLRPVFSQKHQPLGAAWIYLMTPQQVQRYGGIPISTGVWSQHQWPSISPT